MRVGLDTSVVLRLLVGRPADQTARAVAFLDRLSRRGDHAAVSDLVIAEVCFALQHHYRVPRREAIAVLHEMFEDGEIRPLGAAAEVLAIRGIESKKPGFVDRMIHRSYMDAGGAMATFEKSSGKLKSVRVL